jgi:octopine/nopaline transport system permease protein
MSFDLMLIAASLPKIATGVVLTLKLLVVSLLLGTALGIGAALMRISGSRLLAWPSFAYSYVFRGTPMLVQLFIIYYGLSQFEGLRNSMLWPILREPFWCAVIALSLNEGAYAAEILRAAIRGVDQGLHEAGRALGLSPRQRFMHVTAPIAVRLALPAYGNEMIGLLKGTALVSMIAMNDITGVARTIVAKTFAPYEIFISAAIVYLSITWVIQHGIRAAERHFNRYIKK